MSYKLPEICPWCKSPYMGGAHEPGDEPDELRTFYQCGLRIGTANNGKVLAKNCPKFEKRHGCLIWNEPEKKWGPLNPKGE